MSECDGCQVKKNCYFAITESASLGCPCKTCIVKAICQSQLVCGLRITWVVEDIYKERIKEYEKR